MWNALSILIHFLFGLFIFALFLLPMPKLGLGVIEFMKKHLKLDLKGKGLALQWDMFCWGPLRRAVKFKIVLSNDAGEEKNYENTDYEYLRWFAYMARADWHRSREMASTIAHWILNLKEHSNIQKVSIIVSSIERPLPPQKWTERFLSKSKWTDHCMYCAERTK